MLGFVYLTLDERNTFDICGICFWEDDGIDDFEENQLLLKIHKTLYVYSTTTTINLQKSQNEIQ